jgi:hypothetical protein
MIVTDGAGKSMAVENMYLPLTGAKLFALTSRQDVTNAQQQGTPNPSSVRRKMEAG